MAQLLQPGRRRNVSGQCSPGRSAFVPTGPGGRGVFQISGDALIAVNLSRASIPSKDNETREAVICLPQPEVLQARVDHTRTRTWEVRKTTWVPWGNDQDKLRDASRRACD
jgi:hypothetical protein